MSLSKLVSVVASFGHGWLSRHRTRFQFLAVALAALVAVGPGIASAQPTSNTPPRHVYGKSQPVSPPADTSYLLSLGNEVAHGVYSVTVLKIELSAQRLTKYHVGYFYEDTSSTEHRVTGRPSWITRCDMTINAETWKATGVDIVTRHGVFAAHDSLQLDLIKVKWRTYDTRYVPDNDSRRAVTTSFVQDILDHSGANLEAIFTAVDAAPSTNLPSIAINRPTDLVVADGGVSLVVIGIAVTVGIALVGWLITDVGRTADDQSKHNACNTQSNGIYDVCTAGVRGGFPPGTENGPHDADYWCLRDRLDCCFRNWEMNKGNCDISIGYIPVPPVNNCNIVCH
jgi:hypothetical protein